MQSLAQIESNLGLRYTAFDDTQSELYIDIVSIQGQTKDGMNTKPIDAYRQGIELTSTSYLYNSTQPKIWTGNTYGLVNINTIGLARSWTEYSNTEIVNDQIIEFNPVQYILQGQTTYPYPIYFNNGPQQKEEISIEPFTIPFRQEPELGANPPRQVHAELEDGNNFADPQKGSSLIQQFIDYNQPLDPYYFLDDGQQYIGSTLENSIIIEGYTPLLIRNINPFNDTNDEMIVAQVSASLGTSPSDILFTSALKKLKIELDEDIRETYTVKSATAGYSVYGPSQAIYGTDSIAFNGWLRGS